MAYTPKEEGLIMFDRLVNVLVMIETSNDESAAELNQRLDADPTLSGPLRDLLRGMIQMVREEGIDGDVSLLDAWQEEQLNV